jgi:hypothetical protein
MAAQIQVVAHEEIEEGFLSQIQKWANEVLERGGFSFSLFYLYIAVWKTMEKLQAFYREEKEALGVVTGEEKDFLATHDAWRGYPRVHICQERLKGVPSAIVQGVIHHEISHGLHHGIPEFYTFRFSRGLQEVGRSRGLDLPLLQQFVYLLSVAIKDRGPMACGKRTRFRATGPPRTPHFRNRRGARDLGSSSPLTCPEEDRLCVLPQDPSPY